MAKRKPRTSRRIIMRNNVEADGITFAPAAGVTATDVQGAIEQIAALVAEHTHAQYVPYTGATADLDLGTHNLRVGTTVQWAAPGVLMTYMAEENVLRVDVPNDGRFRTTCVLHASAGIEG